jgi:hypothetical protein
MQRQTLCYYSLVKENALLLRDREISKLSYYNKSNVDYKLLFYSL